MLRDQLCDVERKREHVRCWNSIHGTAGRGDACRQRSAGIVLHRSVRARDVGQRWTVRALRRRHHLNGDGRNGLHRL